MPSIKKLTRSYSSTKSMEKPFQGRTNPNRDIYSSHQWRKLSEAIRSKEPLCRECKKQGVRTAAKVVDHIIPINQGGAAYDESNLQPLCSKCHQSKSGSERHSKPDPFYPGY